ncbi:MAG TPA: CDP-diacylglycerol--serine O-phosphatidyltransferase [Candidatus Dormibacteraeota bacterium]|nr:CDP-diacylglycerol--serine O-phosphatidyltransferase [Candidatus Dormibacteraeota bacterium]
MATKPSNPEQDPTDAGEPGAPFARPQPARLVDVPLRKGVYILPNLITTGGLFCGFYSVIASLRGDLLIAAIAIMAANVFDVLDGRIARLTKTTSRFGIEYDSLCDLVAFGVAPGILIYRWGLEPWGTFGWLAASLYVTAGALRLARFNVLSDAGQKSHFLGLPIPAAAEVIASTVMLYYFFGAEGPTYRHLIVLLMVYALAGLMVSNVRYFSFKEIDLYHRQPFWVLIAGILILKLLIAEPQVCLFAGFFLYAVSGPARSLWISARRLLRRAGKRRLDSAAALL